MPDSPDLPRFEIALTMAGAISAGAYTAGVLDFLVEALDAWQAARERGDATAPRHEVVLRAVSGASAGSVCGAILASSLGVDFVHVRADNAAADGARNPLYDIWVNRIDMHDLLGTRDAVAGRRPLSLLDSTRLTEAARQVIDFGAGLAPRARTWVGEPTRFIFTLTNLRGVPFDPQLSAHAPGAGIDMSMHGDSMRFALQGSGGPGPSDSRPAELNLRWPAQAADKWRAGGEALAQAALASAAFPVGLAPRQISRPVSDYNELPVVVPAGPDQPALLRHISPRWPAINPKPADDYRFVSVDGGVINNEPLDLARVALNGGDPLARNPRDGATACRAVLMIDPFIGASKPGPAAVDEVDMLGALAATFSALINQARFRPADVALALDETIFSRFLIAPNRGGAGEAGNSGRALASGAAGGFGGFFSAAFRQHDFLLGRRNAQRFLHAHFRLPANNPLFDGWRNDATLRKAQAAPDGGDTLPIIPLLGALHPVSGREEALPAWPRGRFDPGTLAKAIDGRLDTVYHAYVTDLMGKLLWPGWRFYLRPKLRKTALAMIAQSLADHRLA